MNSVSDFWHERSIKYGNAFAGVLPKSFPYEVNENLDKWMYGEIKKNIQDKPLKILDLGCGYGRLSKKILADFPKVRISGIDIAKNYVNLYNKTLTPFGKALKGDIRKLPFDKSSFDVIIIVTTLMYLSTLKDQEKSLRELFRVLKPNGKFIIIERSPSGHNLITLYGIINLIRGSKNKEIPAVSFDPDQLTSLVTRCGGEVKKKNGIPLWTLLLPISLILSLVNKQLAKGFMKRVNFLDKKLRSFLTPSLYISYTGSKKI